MLCVDVGVRDVNGASPRVYIVFPCVKHFTYHLCCESLETATVRRRRKGLPEDPTETEAPPLWIKEAMRLAPDTGRNTVNTQPKRRMFV